MRAESYRHPSNVVFHPRRRRHCRPAMLERTAIWIRPSMEERGQSERPARLVDLQPSNVPRSSEEPQAAGLVDGLGPIGGAQFAEDVAEVGLDRLLGDEEALADFAVG